MGGLGGGRVFPLLRPPLIAFVGALHSDNEATMIYYTCLPNRGPVGLRKPADLLRFRDRVRMA